MQSHGWLPTWAKNGQMSGTTGEAKRLEAIQIRLTDGAQSKYDVWYRVHAQSYGWLGWAKNGEKAGTAGLAKRLESIQIKLLPQGSAAPGRRPALLTTTLLPTAMCPLWEVARLRRALA